MNKIVYFLVGPTAIGKSSFALKISKLLNGQIVNADSMQIYKELNILSARPNFSDMKKVKHHLYGYVNGKERYNVEKWCNDATEIIKLSNKKNFTPIFVGGTGLYVKTLINGITPIPKIPEVIKKETNKLFDKIGSENFFKKIIKIDEESSKEIIQGDSQRLKRIWEVYKFTNIKFSDWKKNNNKNFINLKNYKIILFLPDRKKNYERVNKRVYSMIDNGVIDEVKSLLDQNYDNNLPIMKAHGVPEIQKYLDKNLTLDECVYRIQQVTRNYVKRQHTWWNSSKLTISKKIQEFPDQIEPNLNNLGLF